MTREEIYDKVKAVLVDALGVDEEEVKPDSVIRDDLGAESGTKRPKESASSEAEDIRNRFWTCRGSAALICVGPGPAPSDAACPQRSESDPPKWGSLESGPSGDMSAIAVED